jgi:AMMECR1 domain-containing protein
VRKLTLFFAVLTLCNAQCGWAASQKNHSEQATQLASLPMPAVERVSLPLLAREALAVHFNASKFDSLDKLIEATPVCDDYKKPAGMFVTLSSHGKTRACWGSITPTNQDLIRSTVFTTESALTKEYRFPAVRASEWQSLKCQVTIVHSIEPIADISQQNALKYGLLVQYGGRGAVLLPGEVMDAHCQLLKCKLKAGIPVDQPCQIYRIRADVLK